MLGSVPTSPKSLEAYRPIIGDDATDEIVRLGQALKGARVLHVNATAFGGGVAEILGTLVPLMNDVGLHADWQVIRGADDFFNVTKAMHNSLQGMHYDWTPAMRDIWLKYNKLNADLFDDSYDYVVIHDPQPAAVPTFIEERTGSRHGKWVWRCHIDLTDAQAPVWDMLRPHVERYDGAIFTLDKYVKDDLSGPAIFCVPPAIDPLSSKNNELSQDEVNAARGDLVLEPAYSPAFSRALALGLLGSLAVFCIHNLFDNLLVHGVGIQIGVLLGLIGGVSHR